MDNGVEMDIKPDIGDIKPDPSELQPIPEGNAPRTDGDSSKESSRKRDRSRDRDKPRRRSRSRDRDRDRSRRDRGDRDADFGLTGRETGGNYFLLTFIDKVEPNFVLQLNQYETAPNFIQLTQNLTWDCLLI